jgi:hypothetical protein
MAGKTITGKEYIALLKGAMDIINRYERLTKDSPKVGFEWYALNATVALHRKYTQELFALPDKEG